MPISLILLLFFVAFGEAWVAHKRPAWLAPLARVPLHPETSIPLTPAARDGLTSTREPAGYREAPVESLDLRKLTGPRVVQRDGLGVFLFPERGLVVVREGYSLLNRARPIVKMRIRPEAERLAVTASYYPSGLATVLLGGLGCVVLCGPSIPPIGGFWVFIAIACAIVYGLSYEKAKACARTGVAEIQARLPKAARLASGGVRIQESRAEETGSRSDGNSDSDERARLRRRS